MMYKVMDFVCFECLGRSRNPSLTSNWFDIVGNYNIVIMCKMCKKGIPPIPYSELIGLKKSKNGII